MLEQLLYIQGEPPKMSPTDSAHIYAQITAFKGFHALSMTQSYGRKKFNYFLVKICEKILIVPIKKVNFIKTKYFVLYILVL